MGRRPRLLERRWGQKGEWGAVGGSGGQWGAVGGSSERALLRNNEEHTLLLLALLRLRDAGAGVSLEDGERSRLGLGEGLGLQLWLWLSTVTSLLLPLRTRPLRVRARERDDGRACSWELSTVLLTSPVVSEAVLAELSRLEAARLRAVVVAVTSPLPALLLVETDAEPAADVSVAAAGLWKGTWGPVSTPASVAAYTDAKRRGVGCPTHPAEPSTTVASPAWFSAAVVMLSCTPASLTVRGANSRALSAGCAEEPSRPNTLGYPAWGGGVGNGATVAPSEALWAACVEVTAWPPGGRPAGSWHGATSRAPCTPAPDVFPLPELVREMRVLVISAVPGDSRCSSAFSRCPSPGAPLGLFEDCPRGRVDGTTPYAPRPVSLEGRELAAAGARGLDARAGAGPVALAWAVHRRRNQTLTPAARTTTAARPPMTAPTTTPAPDPPPPDPLAAPFRPLLDPVVGTAEEDAVALASTPAPADGEASGDAMGVAESVGPPSPAPLGCGDGDVVCDLDDEGVRRFDNFKTMDGRSLGSA
jgi:hypothetical protein